MDKQPCNGWPNVFTWQVFTHLSSSQETDDAARALVAQASSPFEADEALRAWVEACFRQWDETGAVVHLHTLWGDLVHAALRQVDWARLTQTLSE
jgi:hypothetical protein